MPVLFMSGYTDVDALRGVSWAPDTFIQKPFRTEALARFVRQALDRDEPPAEDPITPIC